MNEKNKLKGKKKKIEMKVLEDPFCKEFMKIIMESLKQLPEEDLKKLDTISDEDSKILAAKFFEVESFEEFKQCIKSI